MPVCSPSVLASGVTLQEEHRETRDGRNETKIWKGCPEAGPAEEGSVILSIPGAFQADSPSALERCCFHQLPSSAALPLLPLVPGATRLCPASVCALGLPRVSSTSLPFYRCDHLFFLENRDLCVLALSFGGGSRSAAERGRAALPLQEGSVGAASPCGLDAG